MTEIIDFAAAKAERTPHWQGLVVCLACRHEWQGVGPEGHRTGLDCPACLLPQGVNKHLFGARVGDPEFRCSCGCAAMIAYYSGPRFVFRCMACGENQTEAIFGGIS